MKSKLLNKTVIEGVLYQHSLELKTTGPDSKAPGTEFITGTIDVATNDALTNIITVHFTYVTAKTSTGKANSAFSALGNIISGNWGTYISDGDAAARVKIDSTIGLNEFYSDRNGEEALVSVKRNEGGFIRLVDKVNEDENQRNTFETDMLITKVTVLEEDEVKKLPARAVVKGCVFDFRKALLPVEFTAINPNAIAYFDGLGVSDKAPMFTKVWGRQISTTTSREIRTESAFGDDDVKIVESTRKDWIITGAQKTPYDWDTEETMTAAELKSMITDRNTYLATLKQRSDEYKASKANKPVAGKGGFNF